MDQLCVEVAEGTDVMSWVESLGASVSFGCRAGMCGTCVVTVAEGAGHLSCATLDEMKTLEEIGAKPGQRLACQLKVYGDVLLMSS